MTYNKVKGVRIIACNPDFVNHDHKVQSTYIDDIVKIPYEIDDGQNVYQTKIMGNKKSSYVKNGNYCLINGNKHNFQEKYTANFDFKDYEFLLIDSEVDPTNFYIALKKDSKNQIINEKMVHYPDFTKLMRKITNF